MKIPFLNKYRKDYSENKLWEKIKRFSKKAGVKTVYPVLLLYYAFLRKETSAKAKGIIIGTLGYFIAPIDLIPDLNPIIGFNDDLSLLTFAMVLVACYINEDVRDKAKKKLTQWFGEIDEQQIADIDAKL
ncbi:MAG: YkvA family protein [Bacteroidota bacterium]